MSLHLLNAGGVLQDRYRGMVGPSRVATAVVQQHGPEALRAWHGEFGDRIFDHWRYPSPREYRDATLDALAATGLPSHLAEAAATDTYDDVLRRSTDEAILPVGLDVGTPVVHVDGAAYFGPILNAVPLGDAAAPALRRHPAAGRKPRLLRAETHAHLATRRATTERPTTTRR